MSREKTGKGVASTASAILSNPQASARAKSIAGSALSQVVPGRSTSKPVATKAANALDDGRSGANSRSVAGSVLTQKGRK
jgi:hypothetical protein